MKFTSGILSVSALCALCSISLPGQTFTPDQTLGGFSVGGIKLMCRERRGWDVDFRREVDPAGVEYAVVEMRRGTPASPAPFNLSFNIPKRDIVAAWRPWSNASSFGMYWNPNFLPSAGKTDFCKWMPVYACYSSGGRNRMTFAASESSQPIRIFAGIKEEDNRLYFSFHYYDDPAPEQTHVVAKLRLDPRNVFWSDAVREAADWMTAVSGRTPAPVPDAAFQPLYSTWYCFHQDVHQDEIERECRIASEMGMKTIIVDDGWQTDDNNRGYAYCGDWIESKRRFPDIAAHVARVHKMGMKYMLWYSVPFIGDCSANRKRFEGKFLYYNKSLKAHVLDPRFPDVREFLVSTYENAVRNWNIDGLKLDFIDSFSGAPLKAGEPLAGRDCRSVTEATEKLIAEIYRRLSALKKDILIEFRQAYIGPSIRAGANMLRVGDCPADWLVNRRGAVNLRLTSGATAVHSDMLEWHPSETPEKAAKNILSVIFSTVQYSMKLSGLDPLHAKMIAHWSRFGARHVDALQRGSFRAHHPELSYPLLEGESAAKRIFGVYASEIAVRTGVLDRDVYVLNATDATTLLVELPSTGRVTAFDTYGRQVGSCIFERGAHRMSVPAGGYLLIRAR